MNERIQELISQSKRLPYEHNVSLESFAELIVQECADLFDKDEIELTLTKRTIHIIIKEHFGVKE